MPHQIIPVLKIICKYISPLRNNNNIISWLLQPSSTVLKFQKINQLLKKWGPVQNILNMIPYQVEQSQEKRVFICMEVDGAVK
jgi:hypothetical protein